MNKSESFGRVSGFIDSETEIKGDISFKDSFRIDGKFSGKILSGTTLIIGEGGNVEADIEVGSISINGSVKGTVVAKERAEIFSRGRVTGKIVAPKLVIEEGAFFQGTCQMVTKSLESKTNSDKEPAQSVQNKKDNKK